jgi:hypothetical protein
MVHAGLAYIATADAAAMSAAERARCLRELEEADAVATAARTSVLGVFAAGQDYADDGDYSPCSWLMHRTRVTKGTAVGHTGWMKRGAGHPAVMAALAARQVSTSYAREICWWTDKLPAESRARRMRSCSARRWRIWGWQTWLGWPRRCTSGPGRTSRTTKVRTATARDQGPGSMTGR